MTRIAIEQLLTASPLSARMAAATPGFAAALQAAIAGAFGETPNGDAPSEGASSGDGAEGTPQRASADGRASGGTQDGAPATPRAQNATAAVRGAAAAPAPNRAALAELLGTIARSNTEVAATGIDAPPGARAALPETRAAAEHPAADRAAIAHAPADTAARVAGLRTTWSAARTAVETGATRGTGGTGGDGAPDARQVPVAQVRADARAGFADRPTPETDQSVSRGRPHGRLAAALERRAGADAAASQANATPQPAADGLEPDAGPRRTGSSLRTTDAPPAFVTETRLHGATPGQDLRPLDPSAGGSARPDAQRLPTPGESALPRPRGERADARHRPVPPELTGRADAETRTRPETPRPAAERPLPGAVAPIDADDTAALSQPRSLPLRSREDGRTDSLRPVVTRRETHFAPVMPPQRHDAITARPTATTPPVDTASAAPLPADQGGGQDTRPATEQLGRALERMLPELRPADAPRTAASPAAAADAAARIQAQSRSGPVRVVEIQLQPATLGTLTVTMRLSSAGLKVSVSASVRETATRLSDDRSELMQLIRRAGYESADVTVEAAGAWQGGAGDGDTSRRDHEAPERQERRDPAPDRPGRRSVRV